MKSMLFALVLAVAASPATAEEQGAPLFTEGDWSVFKGDKNFAVATVAKGDRAGLALTCAIDSEVCSWALMYEPRQCEGKSRMPVILRSNNGIQMASEMSCSLDDRDLTGFELRGTDSISSFVRDSDSIQIAADNGTSLEVLDFPTKGYLKATERLHSLYPPKK
ncbi:hypothetical protein [uncultured Stenotrophomonas sp.]|uniref:hypothetical protein n=1 Tax=uncultured Stenotrophomonas sp. TaxID=165438 RepID=UPI002587D70E|nr:hypothetical protein [uncultured Stenotrophomonas sp.]